MPKIYATFSLNPIHAGGGGGGGIRPPKVFPPLTPKRQETLKRNLLTLTLPL